VLRLTIAAVWLLLASTATGYAQPSNLSSSEDSEDRVLVIGTKEAPPFAMKAEDGTWSGISIDLWRRIAEKLHLNYRLKETTLQGLVDQTANRTLDAAVAAITVTNEREQVVDFTQPFYATGLGIAVPKLAKFDWWHLLGSLISFGFLEALIALVGITVLVGLVVWLLERRHSAHFHGVRKGLVTSVWWSALTMTQAGAEQEPGTFFGRLIAIAWMATSVIAIAIFTAGVTSQITAKQLQGVVHGADDLRFARVGAVSETASLDYLTKQGVGFRTYDAVADGLAALSAGKIDAFVYDRPLLAWYIHTKFGDSVTLLDTTFDKQSYAIALPNDSPLRMRINVVLLELTNSQWWDDLNTKYLGKE
jgi:polar amino acid transport system substrate-binding protein